MSKRIGNPDGGPYAELAVEIVERTGAAGVVVLVVGRGRDGCSVSIPASAAAFRATAGLLRDLASKMEADAGSFES